MSLGASPAVPWQRVVLKQGQVVLRPLEVHDARDWRRVRERNLQWLTRWEATRPPGDPAGPHSFRAMVRELRRQAKQGRCVPLALTVDGAFAGQVTINSITGGSGKFCSVGYWIDQAHAGKGHMPVAVAMAVDYLFTHMGLHRAEVAIRPENSASLRVVEKLGLAEYGYAPRYLHIDGDWRDHRLFAITTEEVPDGLLRRFLSRSTS